MSLTDLYHDIILDHGKKPRNFRAIEGAPHAEGFNPLCGDRVTVYLLMDGERVADVAFEGAGCAICMASASLMTEAVRGAAVDDAQGQFDRFRTLLTGDDEPPAELGSLAALVGVRRFPMRVKCATLPWHTMQAVLEKRDDVVSTE